MRRRSYATSAPAARGPAGRTCSSAPYATTRLARIRSTDSIGFNQEPPKGHDAVVDQPQYELRCQHVTQPMPALTASSSTRGLVRRSEPAGIPLPTGVGASCVPGWRHPNNRPHKHHWHACAGGTGIADCPAQYCRKLDTGRYDRGLHQRVRSTTNDSRCEESCSLLDASHAHQPRPRHAGAQGRAYQPGLLETAISLCPDWSTSRARFSFSTLTRGTPKIPRSGPVMWLCTSCDHLLRRTASAPRPRAAPAPSPPPARCPGPGPSRSVVSRSAGKRFRLGFSCLQRRRVARSRGRSASGWSARGSSRPSWSRRSRRRRPPTGADGSSRPCRTPGRSARSRPGCRRCR